jgi:hypothetical protein
MQQQGRPQECLCTSTVLGQTRRVLKQAAAGATAHTLKAALMYGHCCTVLLMRLQAPV